MAPPEQEVGCAGCRRYKCSGLTVRCKKSACTTTNEQYFASILQFNFAARSVCVVVLMVVINAIGLLDGCTHNIAITAFLICCHVTVAYPEMS